MGKRHLTIVDEPKVSLDEDENAGEVLLKFYRALGWNGEDYLDPCKVRTDKTMYNHLYETMYEKFPNSVAVGMHMLDRGPGIEDNIPQGKVCLLEGWITPAGQEKGEDTNGNEAI